MEVSAVRTTVLRDRNFSSTESSGAKGPLWSPARTIERSQEGCIQHPTPCWRHLLWQKYAGTLVLWAPRTVERQGLSRGWGSGDTAGRYPLSVYRGAMPTSGPGSVASAEVVSYEAIQVAWLQLRMPYAPGASETVSVVPHSWLWRNSGSSALLGHVPPWGVPSYSPSLTPHWEKRFSAQRIAYSFPSWPEAPTGWGAGVIPVIAQLLSGLG